MAASTGERKKVRSQRLSKRNEEDRLLLDNHKDVGGQLKSDNSLCSFCQAETAAVVIITPPVDISSSLLSLSTSSNKKKRKREERYYCLLHYYTTSAVRTRVQPSEESPAGTTSASRRNASVPRGPTVQVCCDEEELKRQLGTIQELFAEAFVQLQQELSEESARSFQLHQDDPLSMLHHWNPASQAGKKTLKKPPAPATALSSSSSGLLSEGGFLPKTSVPQRLLQTQQQQAQLHRDMTARMNGAAAKTTLTPSWKPPAAKVDLSQRRKSSRKSIWNTILEQDLPVGDAGESAHQDVMQQVTQEMTAVPEGVVCSSCGSKDVELLGSNTSRNQDMRKGETWGTKDRGDEVVTRYRCLHCGKTWNQEE